MPMAPQVVKDQSGNPKTCNYKNKSVGDSFQIFFPDKHQRKKENR